MNALRLLAVAVLVTACYREQPPKAAAAIAHDDRTTVLVRGQRWQCTFRTFADSERVLLYPALNHIARPACDAAFHAWLEHRR